MPTQKLTPEIITAAIDGFEARKTHIDSQIAELRAMLAGGPSETAGTPETAPKKRKISSAARQRMALAQKARWAGIKGESEASAPVAAPVSVEPKRKLSAAGKAILVANLEKARAAKAAKVTAAKKAPLVSKKAAGKKAVKAPLAMPAKKKLSPARKAALVANLAKARAARAAKRADGSFRSAS